MESCCQCCRSYPILLAGIVAPLLWTGLLWSTLNVIDPLLDARLDWGWFVLCQIAFGITAGIVVGRSEKIRTLQHLSFAVRSGVEGDAGSGGESSEAQRLAGYAAAALALAMISCVRPIARAASACRSSTQSLNQVTDFATLYGENCAGCHGSNGNFGGALPLNNPAYLAIVDDESVRDAIAKGHRRDFDARICREQRRHADG